MSVRIWHRIGNWNLRISASASLAVHLSFILAFSLLFSGIEVRQASIRHVKVTLHPLEKEEKSVSELAPRLSVKNSAQRPKKGEPIQGVQRFHPPAPSPIEGGGVHLEKQEPKPAEPIPKMEIKPPRPLPVQTVETEIPSKEPERASPPPEEEKIVKPSEMPTTVAALGTDLTLNKEENHSPPAPSSPPGATQENKLSETISGELTGKGQGGSSAGDSGNGSGAGKSAFSWRGPGEATGVGHGSPSGGTGNGSGSGSRSGTGSGFGSGSGSGAGSGQGESDGEVSRRGKGIWAKLFSSHGDRGAGGAGAPGRGGAGGIPRYAQNPKPPYPQEAREKGYQGEVLLRVEVLSDGRVGQIEIRRSSGHELLDRSALSTVKQWKFVPAQKGKDPVPLWVNIPVKFQLQ